MRTNSIDGTFMMRFVAHMARGLYKNEGLSCEEGALGSSISGSVTSESTEGFDCPELDTIYVYGRYIRVRTREISLRASSHLPHGR